MVDWIETVKLHAAKQVAAIGQPRHALVTSVDATAHAVKVTIQPEGIESGWIPDASLAAAQGLKIACPTEIGSQVLVVPVEGDSEHPVLIARVFDVTTQPPTSPATDKVVQPGELGIFLENGNYLHLTAAGIYLKGSVTVDGSLTATGDIVASGVSLTTHIHDEVQSGQGKSGMPAKQNG